MPSAYLLKPTYAASENVAVQLDSSKKIWARSPSTCTDLLHSKHEKDPCSLEAITGKLQRQDKRTVRACPLPPSWGACVEKPCAGVTKVTMCLLLLSSESGPSLRWHAGPEEPYRVRASVRDEGFRDERSCQQSSRALLPWTGEEPAVQRPEEVIDWNPGQLQRGPNMATSSKTPGQKGNVGRRLCACLQLQCCPVQVWWLQ